ncbi:hypothetical protein H8356DRAFT_1062634 [Neocallimastix lanati (nom. inval.)]|nr:hypothetical protein H8356DRAFT_1062634 [Neocallimastix sp. JGI-2020a]
MSDIHFKELKKELKDIEKLSKDNLDIKTWCSDLELWVELGEVTDERKIFLACVLTSTGEPRQIIQELGNQINTNDSSIDNDEEDSSSGSEFSSEKYYPSLQEITNALEEFYGTKEDQNILLRELRVLDYVDALENNQEAWKRVALEDDLTLSKAYQIAEKVDRLQNRSTQGSTQPRQNFTSNNSFSNNYSRSNLRSSNTNNYNNQKSFDKLRIERGSRSSPIVNKTASLKYHQESINKEFSNIKEILDSENFKNSNHLIAAMTRNSKRKSDQVDSITHESGRKRSHRSLKDNPITILTPALRKKQEEEMTSKTPQEKYKNQVSPSILTEPRIEKEKMKEKAIRDKERAETNQILDSDFTKENVTEGNKSDQNLGNHISLTRLINDQLPKDNIPENKNIKISRKIQMQINKEPYDVIDLNKTQCNITFGKLLDVSPKIRTQVSHGLRLERNQTKVTGVVDNLSATTVMVNNIEHTYKS